MYWQVQQLANTDDRFNYYNFSRQPMWLVRQAVTHLENERNLDQITQAQQVMTLFNIHRDSKSTPEPFKDIADFLPHPNTWRKVNMTRKLSIDRKTARLFLQSYTKFGSEVVMTFEDWLPEIRMIANG